MTALATEAPPRPSAAAARWQRGALVEHVAVAAAMLWWALPLTRATGGREPHVLSIGLVLMTVALAATRPWQRLRSAELMAAAALVVAPLVVCLASPIGWDGANELGNWAFAVGAFVVLRAYVRDAVRLRAALGFVALAGLVEFTSSWLAWWGGEDPSRPMIGTFYWHNQYAAFLLVPAVVGVALAVWPRRPGVAIGWVVAPLCSVGVLFSTSRATIGLLALGWAGTFLVALWMPGRGRALARLVAVAAITVATGFLLTGPPFFPHRAAPSSAVAARSEQQSASGDASYRTKTWHEAVVVYREHPATGTGFHGFASAATAAEPHQPHSAFAHDAWLQALSDGGSVLGLPFLLASLATAGAILAGIARRVRRRADPVGAVVGLAALLLAAHSAVDFDTSYPALFAALAVAAALGLASPAGQPSPDAPRRRTAVAVVAIVAAVSLVAVAPAWHGGMQLNMNVPGGAPVPGGAH